MNVSSSAMRLDANAISTATREGGGGGVAGCFGGSRSVFVSGNNNNNNNQKLYDQQHLTLRKSVRFFPVCSSAAKPVNVASDKKQQVNASAGLGRIESLSQVSGVLGCQWGDEGKGKLVDILAKHFDIVARCQVPL